MKTTFKGSAFFSVPKKELFEFHEQKDAFLLLTPPSFNIEVLNTASNLKPSAEVVRFVAHFMFLKFKFGMIHIHYSPYDLFVDQQKEGLFTHWKHHHRFFEAGWEQDPSSLLVDEITYAHPLLRLFNPFVRSRLKELFRYRHHKTAQELYKRLPEVSTSFRVAVTGATGLIGIRIIQILLEKGVEVTALVRDVVRGRELLGEGVNCVQWDFDQPAKGGWKKHLNQAEAVIHLAGTPLFKQRWTSKFKKQMEESRVLGTRQLAEAILSSPSQVKTFITASAVGIYGKEVVPRVDELSKPADDLLAGICQRWEGETDQMLKDRIRMVQIRIGIVLSRGAGVLKELMTPFKLGAGGVMGKSDPFINWIHLEDVARIFITALFNQGMHGPYNAVAPNPVTNRAFAKTLGRVLHRPVLLRYPQALIKVMIGEAGEYVSGGPEVAGHKIQEAGYRFFFDQLKPALENVLLKK